MNKFFHIMCTYIIMYIYIFPEWWWNIRHVSSLLIFDIYLTCTTIPIPNDHGNGWIGFYFSVLHIKRFFLIQVTSETIYYKWGSETQSAWPMSLKGNQRGRKKMTKGYHPTPSLKEPHRRLTSLGADQRNSLES